jgi:hypothetical protein
MTLICHRKSLIDPAQQLLQLALQVDLLLPQLAVHHLLLPAPLQLSLQELDPGDHLSVVLWGWRLGSPLVGHFLPAFIDGPSLFPLRLGSHCPLPRKLPPPVVAHWLAFIGTLHDAVWVILPSLPAFWR